MNDWTKTNMSHALTFRRMTKMCRKFARLRSKLPLFLSYWWKKRRGEQKITEYLNIIAEYILYNYYTLFVEYIDLLMYYITLTKIYCFRNKTGYGKKCSRILSPLPFPFNYFSTPLKILIQSWTRAILQFIRPSI